MRSSAQPRHHMAGRLPPSLSLERPASRSKPSSPVASSLHLSLDSLPQLSPPSRSLTRPRSYSGAAATSGVIQRINVTPPPPHLIGAGGSAMTRTTRSMSDSMAVPDDDDGEEGQLLPGHGRVLRNRSHSAATPSILPQGLLQEPMVWSSRTSKLLVVCASGILFMLLFIFCSVVGLRMAAHVKYDNSLCISRSPTSTRSDDTTDETFGYTSKWVPNYDVETWDQKWFKEGAKRVLTQQYLAAAAKSSDPSPVTPDTDPVTPPLPPATLTDPVMLAAFEKEADQLLQSAAWLPSLRVNHFRTMGTHNSYHIASDLPLSMHQYTHAPLPNQLQTYRKGIRQLELDIHLTQEKTPPEGFDPSLAPSTSQSSHSNGTSKTPGAVTSHPPTAVLSSDYEAGGLVVYHLQWLDDKTTCYCLSECLSLITSWSDAHPAHFPIFLTFEIKSQVWEDVETGLNGVKCNDVERVEREILQVIPRDKLVTPLQVRGGETSPYKTVRTALNEAAKLEMKFRQDVVARRRTNASLPRVDEFPQFDFGWPRLVDAVGKIFVVWLDDMHNLSERLDCVANEKMKTSEDEATSWHHDDDRIIFIAQSSMDRDYASIITQNKPYEAMKGGMILHALTHGYIVRTMTDESADALPDRARFEAALQSGAHLISTDFEDCIMHNDFHSYTNEPIEPGSLDHPQEDTPQNHAAMHAAAASPEQQATDSLSAVIPTPADNVHQPAIYCEHLTDNWPFECNPIASQFFCQNALKAARLHMQILDDEEEK